MNPANIKLKRRFTLFKQQAKIGWRKHNSNKRFVYLMVRLNGIH